jgi:hypothetical protein
MKNNYFPMNTLLFICFLSPAISGVSQTFKEIKIEAQVVKYDNKDCKGSLEIFAIEGLSPFKFSIDGGKTFHDNKLFDNLCEGKYFIQVKDATGSLGITLVNLTSNLIPEIFNDAEYEAIRQSNIKDFLALRERVMDNWELRREVEYKLSRINHRFAPIIVNQSNDNGITIYTYKVIKMNNFSKEIMLMEYDRQLVGYKDYVSEISYNESAGTTTVHFTKLATPEIINNFFIANGFSGL